MKSFVMTIVSIFASSYFLAMFFVDYKENRYYISSIDLATAIITITYGVCCSWNFMSNMLV